MNLTCTNCGKQLLRQDDVYTFQKVICCFGCHEIVVHAYDKAARLVDSVMGLYKEALRMSLIKQQAHLPTLPMGEMPMGELQASMNMLGVLHANGAKKQQTGKDSV